ncbi:hypothetical protein Cylst_0331 [Cylindrospermum stagnale PCC 7417]|uniref:Uncharacterized protein n=1 Tax=Cylindrospermum stagnale PCC 7417 TaxID=56107 RepID=K9WT44_9NOST|nr:hypothetical protein [Cylindrospermum stagnale]AFZ22692.1 hypothetical protein Cylst_0331 [Cylindrospermum stagnale PCC 7417]
MSKIRTVIVDPNIPGGLAVSEVVAPQGLNRLPERRSTLLAQAILSIQNTGFPSVGNMVTVILLTIKSTN